MISLSGLLSKKHAQIRISHHNKKTYAVKKALTMMDPVALSLKTAAACDA